MKPQPAGPSPKEEIPEGQDILAFLLMLAMFVASGGFGKEEDEKG